MMSDWSNTPFGNIEFNTLQKLKSISYKSDLNIPIPIKGYRFTITKILATDQTIHGLPPATAAYFGGQTLI